MKIPASTTALSYLVTACLLNVSHAENLAEAKAPGAPPQAVQNWREMGFGMFIHWGLVSLKGTEIGWSRGREVPIEEYDQLRRRPVGPDCRRGRHEVPRHHVEASRRVLHLAVEVYRLPHRQLSIPARRVERTHRSLSTTRHCVWNLPLGLRVSSRLSDGKPGGKVPKPKPNLDRCIDHLRNQVTELIENYGPLSTMWFDVPREVYPEHGIPTVELVRTLPPVILVNKRA